MNNPTSAAPGLVDLMLGELAKAEEEVGITESELSSVSKRIAEYRRKEIAIKDVLEAFGHGELGDGP